MYRPTSALPPSNLIALPSRDPDSDTLNVVVETTAGSRNKFKYDSALGLFRFHKVLPLGASFPFDFGFIPSTRGEDGDPLDVLLLLDEPAFPGCLVSGRLLGVIKAEQREKDGTKERNDRLIAVAAATRLHQDVHSVKELNPVLLDEIEHFFISYNETEGKRFKPLGRSGPRRAGALVEEGVRRYQELNAAGKAGNGRVQRQHKQ